MMMIRATRDLAANAEITFWYHVPVENEYDERQKKFQQWNFKCDCIMCLDDQITEKNVWAKRMGLRAELLKRFLSGKRGDGAKIETIIATMTSLYNRPASEVPRLGMWDPQLTLAKMYMQQGQPVKAIDSALGVLTSLGYVVDGGKLPRASRTTLMVKQWGLMLDRLIECWMLLASAYHLLAPDLEAQAEEYARISYKICIGEDETFDETYGKLSDLYGGPYCRA
jgi:hypothetical protein